MSGHSLAPFFNSVNILFQDDLKSPQMVLFDITEVLGKPSEAWWLRWEEPAAEISDTRRHAAGCNDGPARFDDMINELDYESTEKESQKDMLRRMLALEPGERLYIQKVQDHT